MPSLPPLRGPSTAKSPRSIKTGMRFETARTRSSGDHLVTLVRFLRKDHRQISSHSGPCATEDPKHAPVATSDINSAVTTAPDRHAQHLAPHADSPPATGRVAAIRDAAPHLVLRRTGCPSSCVKRVPLLPLPTFRLLHHQNTSSVRTTAVPVTLRGSNSAPESPLPILLAKAFCVSLHARASAAFAQDGKKVL